MISCPIKECGRKFENNETMLQHVRRRHPNQYNSVRQDATKSLIQKQHAQQQELSKLPRLAKVMNKEVGPLQKVLQVQKRSSSKTRKLQSANLSSLIQESRLTTVSSATNKTPITGRRPSLNKKVSSSDLRIEKLPPIDSELKKSTQLPQIQKIQPLKKMEAVDHMYSTMPDFKQKGIKVKSNSKGKVKEVVGTSQKIVRETNVQKAQPQNFRSTMTTIITKQKSIQDHRSNSKKGLIRPTKKIQKKASQKNLKQVTSQQVDFDQKIVTIKSWSDSQFTCPSGKKIQLLFLNNCGLHDIFLNSLQSLIQVSATHNHLKSMQFLNYSRNHNLKVIHLDHNEIQEFYSPPKLKVLTLSFNNVKTQKFPQVLASLRKSAQIQEIDLSFNNVRKTENYKLRVLSVCSRMKSIDGLKVTKIDIEMMEQFLSLQYKQKGLIPLGSPSQDRPTTAVSEMEQTTQVERLMPKTIAELEKQQKQYEKLIKQTEEQLKVIRKQNQIISSQLEGLKYETKQMSAVWDSANLLNKLQKQCEFLELLNIMQHADQQQLVAMIEKKKQELGLQIN